MFRAVISIGYIL